jgi:predicted AlkP superfamily phosphohydrolase/phosphomutase
MTPSPLVIIAFDAADAEVIQEWSREGRLPTLTSLMNQGCWGRITGRELISTQGAWLSFFSGLSAALHGYYYHRQLRPGTYDLYSHTAHEARARPFWAQSIPGSLKALIIDAFETNPVPGLAGIQLGNWAVQQGFNTAPLPILAEPVTLLQEAPRLAGQQIHVDVYKPGSSLEEDIRAHHLLVQRVEQKAKLVRHYLQQNRYDLIVIGFCEAHTAAHRFWDYGAGESGQAIVDGAQELVHALRDVYQALDRQVGRLLVDIGKANVFIVSLFGMKAHYPTSGLINAFCRQLGYHVLSQSSSQPLTPLALIRRIVPGSWRARTSRLLPTPIQDRLGADLFRSQTDWSRTRAFPLPSLNVGYIRVNLRGREPQGLVEPGKPYTQLLDDIEADLAHLVDVKTGRPAVENVMRIAESLGQDPPWDLPDLCIEWKAAPYLIERLSHPTGEITQQRMHYNRSSGHNFIGSVVAAGPSINKSGFIGETGVLEFAPAFLSLLNRRGPEEPSARVSRMIAHATT